VNSIDFFIGYNNASSAEGIIMFAGYEALHLFWNYMSIPWGEEHSILKSS
jgi:hypothetical protein